MMSTAKKIGQFIKLRDHKQAMKKEFDKSCERINQALEKLEGEILSDLNDSGSDSVNTKMGTAYKNTQMTATVKDREAFEEWARTTGNTGAMDIKANKTAIREIMDSGAEVPGVKVSERVTVGIRVPRKK